MGHLLNSSWASHSLRLQQSLLEQLTIINTISLGPRWMEAGDHGGVGFGAATVPFPGLTLDNCTLQRVLASTAATVKMLMQQFNKYLMVSPELADAIKQEPHY